MKFDDETTDVLIGGYLSKDAAQDDYEAVLASGGYLHGAVVVSKDLKGNLSVEQTDHMVREGAAGLGAIGFAVGLFALPARRDRGRRGDRCRGRQTAASQDRQQARGAGRGRHPGRQCRPDRRLPALRGRQSRTGRDPPHQKVVGEAEGNHVNALKGALADAQQKMAESGDPVRRGRPPGDDRAGRTAGFSRDGQADRGGLQPGLRVLLLPVEGDAVPGVASSGWPLTCRRPISGSCWRRTPGPPRSSSPGKAASRR